MNKNLFARLFTLYAGIISGVTAVHAGIGNWKNYTDMSNVVGIASAGNAVWVGTSGGIIRYNPADSSFQKFTNSEGLTGNDVSVVGMDTRGSVWVGELSGQVDIYTPSTNSWKNVSDIALSVQTQKMITAFCAHGDTMYIGTAFGVSVFSVSKFEFGDTYSNMGSFLHPSVACLTVFDGRIYAGTSNGLAVSKIGALNLAAPESWDSYPTPTPVRAITVSYGTVYAGTSSGVYAYQNGSWRNVSGTPQTIVALVNIDSVLCIVTQNNVVTLSSANTIGPYGGTAPATITCAVADSSNRLYAGLQEAGIGVLKSGTSQWVQNIPNSPASSFFPFVAVDEKGTVWAASAGPGGINGVGFYSFDGDHWRNYNLSNTPQLNTNQFFNVAIGPNNSKWFGSWGAGVALVDGNGNLVRVFDNNNPGFVGAVHPAYVVIGQPAFDAAGNVWIPNFSSLDNNVLWEMLPDSTWKSIQAPAATSFTHLLGVTIDRYGTKWFVNDLPGFESNITFHCVYYNETNAVSGLASDGWGEIQSSSGLASVEVTCVAQDKQGSLWLGSNFGISIIGDPSSPTSQISSVFLGAVEGQYINTIAVDPLNNKWVAMQSGVAVLSPDGTSLVAEYNVGNTNGKLVDNNVLSIAFDEKKGIVYFGTSKGLSSLEIPAIGTVEKMSTLEIGPNPFILPDQSSVTIKGLADNTTIKILTISGRLIKEFAAQGGGRAIWDGTDFRGNSVGSGVYIIVAFADNGNQVSTAKVAVLRR